MSIQNDPTFTTLNLPVVDALPETIREYGQLLRGYEFPPLAGGAFRALEVKHGYRASALAWWTRLRVKRLKRYPTLPQLFVAHRDRPFCIVLCPSSHQDDHLPDLTQVHAFRIPSGYGLLVSQPVWHAISGDYTPLVLVATEHGESVPAPTTLPMHLVTVSLADQFSCEIQLNLAQP